MQQNYFNEYWNTNKDIPKDIVNDIKRIIKNAQVVQTIRLQGDFKNPILLYEVNDSIFKKLLTLNRKVLYKEDCVVPTFKTDYTANRNYVTSDGLSGFSLTPDNWLVSIYSNDNTLFLDVLSSFLCRENLYRKVTYKLVSIVTGDADLDYIKTNKLVQLYMNKLNMNIVAYCTDDVTMMLDIYGEKFTESFCKFYNSSPKYVILTTDTIEPNKVNKFDNVVKAIDYVNNL